MFTRRTRYLTRLAITALLLGVGAVAGVPASPVQAYSCSGSGTVTCAFSFTGSEEHFIVPAGVTAVTVLAAGGKGSAEIGAFSGDKAAAGEVAKASSVAPV